MKKKSRIKTNYINRIKSLIENNHDDSQILKIIYNEFAIILKKRTVSKYRRDELKQNITEDSKLDLITQISSKNKTSIEKDFKAIILSGFLDLNDFDPKIKKIIKVILRDNKITEIEEDFLNQKFEEINRNNNISAKDLSEYINSNNPYFDDLFSIIWGDKIIKSEELLFLKEKIKENKHDKKNVNKRFWQYSILYHLEDLKLKYNFIKIIKLYHINKTINSGLSIGDFEDSLNIFDLNQEFNLLIDFGIENIESYVISFLQENDIAFELEYLYSIIDLDDSSIFVLKKESPEPSKKSINKMVSNQLYTKKDIYELLNVPEFQKGGKWNNGYCEHKGNWFIFCNINKTGKGYFGENFDYNNSFDSDGNLNWEARHGSRLIWETVQKISKSNPYIFTKNGEEKTSYWNYIGTGECINIEDTIPVKFKWKIHKQDLKVPSIIKPSEKEASPFDDILKVYHENPFEAFELYKKIILKNNPKIRTNKLSEGFDELINS